MDSTTRSPEESTINWQDNKSQAETKIHISDHELPCDVTFLTGKNKTPVRAHKSILASRSPVFYTMFPEPMAGSEDAITVSDVEPQVLEALFRFMYTENCNLSGENVMALMYAAHKYAVTSLVKECGAYLKETIGIDNACTALQHAVAYGERELVDACLAYITCHGQEVLKSEHFKEADRQTLKKIIELDNLNIKEEHVYQACIEWAKHQCESDDKTASDQNIRGCLGEILYLVRFPTMPIETFTKVVSNSNILTDSERMIVFQSYEDMSAYTHIFSTSPRSSQGKEVVIERFDIINPGWTHKNKTDAILFSCSEDTHLYGVSLFTPILKRNYTKGILEILEGDLTLYKQDVTVRFHSSKKFVDILFNRKLNLLKDKKYTLQQTLSGNQTFHGESGIHMVATDKFLIQFFKSENDTNGTDEDRGQLYRMFFSW